MKNFKFLLLMFLFVTIVSYNINVKAFTKTQIEAMKRNGIDTTNLVPEGANDVLPQNLEKSLSTQVLKDKKGKVIFIDTLNTPTKQKSFFNNLDFFKNVKLNVSQLYTDKYNLTKSQINQITKNYEACTYRNSTTCLKATNNIALKYSEDKSLWNWYLIIICQFGIGINIFIWLMYFFSTKKVVEVEINEV